MKLTKQQLKKLIKEELKIVLNEVDKDDHGWTPSHSPAWPDDPDDWWSIPAKYARRDLEQQPWEKHKMDMEPWAKKAMAHAQQLQNLTAWVPEYTLWILAQARGDDDLEQAALTLASGEAAAAEDTDTDEAAGGVSEQIVSAQDRQAIMQLDSYSVQRILRHVDGRTLVTALSAYPEDLRNHIISNLSARAGAVVLEDLESLGPVSENQAREAHSYVMEGVAKLTKS